MTLEDIQKKLEKNLPNAQVYMSGDGCNCTTTIISPQFEALPLLARQKMILSVMGDEIQSGELHALSIKAYTQAEYKNIKQ